MLTLAAGEVAAREQQIAAQEVDAAALLDQAMRQPLPPRRMPARGRRRRDRPGHAARGQPEPGTAALGRRRPPRRAASYAACASAIDPRSCNRSARQQASSKRGPRLTGECQSAIGKSSVRAHADVRPTRYAPHRGKPAPRQAAPRGRGARRAGSDRVRRTSARPCRATRAAALAGATHTHLRGPARARTRLRRLPRERVHARTGFPSPARTQKVVQRGKREALAEHRRHSHGVPFGRLESVQPCLHDALDRAGKRRLAGSRLQEMLQEQRVAAGPFHAADRECLVAAAHLRRHRAGFRPVQRPEVERDEPADAGGAAPGGVQAGRRRCARSSPRSLHSARPRPRARRPGSACARVPSADPPGGAGAAGPRCSAAAGSPAPRACRAHAPGGPSRRTRRATPAAAGVQQIEQVCLVRSVDEAPRAMARSIARVLGLAPSASHIEQPAHDRTHRIAVGADAEVEHQAGVTGDVVLVRDVAECLDKPCLADAGIAADVDGHAGPGLQAGLQRGGELAQLLSPTDEAGARNGRVEHAGELPAAWRPEGSREARSVGSAFLRRAATAIATPRRRRGPSPGSAAAPGVPRARPLRRSRASVGRSRAHRASRAPCRRTGRCADRTRGSASARAQRAARSLSSPWAVGTPKSAMMPPLSRRSNMPPKRSMSSAAAVPNRSLAAWARSGSGSSEIRVDSATTIATTRSSACGEVACTGGSSAVLRRLVAAAGSRHEAAPSAAGAGLPSSRASRLRQTWNWRNAAAWRPCFA